MNDCLFCKIAAGQIPSTKVYEDETVYAFRDINPQAPTHVLVIPRQHVTGMSAINEASDEVLAACLRACRKVAQLEGVEATGYRVVSNCGDDACQTVKHLHFHVMGGAHLAERMA